MTRILYLCHGHPALVPGGTETVAHDLFRAVRERRDCEAMFIGCVSPLHREARPESRLQAIGRSADELLLWVGAFDRFSIAQAETRGFAEAMGELLTSFRPDIVHFHHLSRLGLEAVLLTRRVAQGAKIVLTLHDYHAICANDGLMTSAGAGRLCRGADPDTCHACLPEIAPQRFAARTMHVQNVLRQIDQFIAPSRFLRDRYLAWGLPAAKIELIANGLPVVPVAPAARRSRRTFGFFGNIAPHKGVLVLLDAVRRLAEQDPDARLHLHGGINFQPEPFRRAFDEALAAVQPVVRFHGAYDRSDLPQLMAKVDWVVVPSVWWENAPVVIAEAFQHGRPVICANVGGMAEMVRDGGSGLHFQVGDAADLARVMHRAVDQRGLWGRLVVGIPEPVTVAETTERHLALYDTLLRHEEALSA